MLEVAYKHLISVDPVMAEIIKRMGPVDLKPRRLSPFQSLVHSIIHQQLSGKAAATILERFIALFNSTGFPKPEDVLLLDIDRLRGAGLSKQKVNFILGIASQSLNGGLPSLKECDSLSDEEIVKRLTALVGVGRWTAHMLLMFNLGRLDILPTDDLGVRKGFQIAYRKRKLPDPIQLERFGRKWTPYRTVAACYLWRTVDFLKDDDW